MKMLSENKGASSTKFFRKAVKELRGCVLSEKVKTVSDERTEGS